MHGHQMINHAIIQSFNDIQVGMHLPLVVIIRDQILNLGMSKNALANIHDNNINFDKDGRRKVACCIFLIRNAICLL